ncbi:MAG: prepilin-type N-terminal cleavage/methylation domain-containing protein [Armatimonadetes bacterium]|nr:prepilin-type N-terminal cleavage/methylation domain-containing protein [Armatimonadota bacterium]
MRRFQRGFTLVELLTVIAIIALLAAIIFPVFAAARGKARSTVCVSNLRQIGLAVQMYSQDYDGIVPLGKDSSDAYVPIIWGGQPCAAYMVPGAPNEIPFLHPNDPVKSSGGSNISPKTKGTLDGYSKSDNIWMCPGDTGFDRLDHNDCGGVGCPMDARPTMFEKYGASYLIRTELAFRQVNVDSVSGTDIEGNKVGASRIQFVFDGNGSWHGSPINIAGTGRRYISLFLDGHAKNIPYDKFDNNWGVSIDSTGTSEIANICP